MLTTRPPKVIPLYKKYGAGTCPLYAWNEYPIAALSNIVYGAKSEEEANYFNRHVKVVNRITFL
jgi:hypothetical protein